MGIDFPAGAQIPELLHLWKGVFGDHDGFWELFLETAFSPEHCRCITEDGQITAALYWFDCTCREQKMAYVYAVVTHPGHRGRGLCRKLLEDTHRYLKARGYSAVLLVPEQESLRQMYQKFGYTTCTFVSEFTCTAAEPAIALRAIGPSEYALLRRAFLPENGVVQEQENLSFLSAQAQFYTGQDFLLAAYTDEEILYGMELLGSPDAASGITAALGCKTGRFRTVGTERAFAMLYPLTEAAVTPAYFGFAFD